MWLGRGRGERAKREIWDLEVLQLSFKDKLLGNTLRLQLCDQFLRSFNFLCDVQKRNQIER